MTDAVRRRAVLRSASTAALAGVAGCLGDPLGRTNDQSTPTPTTDMRFIAHRGCMAQYPENTLAAFRESAPAVDMIELDLWRCGSGELVVFHDETLDRVADATGRVDETPYDELRNVDVLDSGEHVPLLSEVFDVVPTDIGLNLELKDTGIAADVVAAATRHDHEVVVSSFDRDELAAAGDAGADSLAFLFSDSADAALDVAADLDCEYVHPHHRLCTASYVETAHDRGFGVNAWTIEERSTIEALRANGVDGAVINDCRHAD